MTTTLMMSGMTSEIRRTAFKFKAQSDVMLVSVINLPSIDKPARRL